MGSVEALELALSKEMEAIQVYQDFSVRYPETKEIFIFLMNEEQKHKQLIEKRISELTG